MKNIFITLLTITAIIGCKKAEQKSGTEQVPPAIFADDMAKNPGQVIDVRTKEEFSESHIENAKNISVYDTDFIKRIDSLDKNETIYIYCKAGARSAEAVDALEHKGFKHIVELEGGLDAWTGAQKPTTK